MTISTSMLKALLRPKSLFRELKNIPRGNIPTLLAHLLLGLLCAGIVWHCISHGMSLFVILLAFAVLISSHVYHRRQKQPIARPQVQDYLVCRLCRVRRPASQFYRDSLGNLFYRCKTCVYNARLASTSDPAQLVIHHITPLPVFEGTHTHGEPTVLSPPPFLNTTCTSGHAGTPAHNFVYIAPMWLPPCPSLF
jgi:hypothetical protein